MYNVALDITPEQKLQLKLRATRRGLSVKAHIRDLVLQDLSQSADSEKKQK